MTARRWGGSGAAAILLLSLWNGIGPGGTPGSPPIRADASPRGATSQALRPQGAGSCAASACHGSMSPADPRDYPSRVLRNEHTTWLTQDRHANAYQVLFSRRSRQMESILTGGTVAAHQDARCLACHSWSGPNPSAASAEVVRQDGVGCESCHGASELWIGAHTQSWWNGLGADDKQARFGMRATRALDRRAALCAECHVGGPGRDVNHDLIAAGHPRLNFEFAAYLANMPPHWYEPTGGTFPARAWSVGQVATARAALDQLRVRALRAKAGAGDSPASHPWPEFSEYDCFSCHHDLADERWRKPAGDGKLTTGTPAWGSWYYPSIAALADVSASAGPAGVGTHLASLRKEMDRFAPDPGETAERVQELSRALDNWLATLPEESSRYDATRLKSLIAGVESASNRGVVAGWDGAAQRYLALQPLRLSLKSLDPRWDDGPLKVELDRSFELLRFPSGFDSPRRFDPASLHGDRGR